MPRADKTSAQDSIEKNRQLFLERLSRVVPVDRLEAVLAHLESPSRVTFRVVQPSLDPMQLEGFPDGLEVLPVPSFPGWFSIPAEQRSILTESSVATGAGLYIQNLSSLFAVLALQPEPGEEVLDLAAAPGGKTLLIANAMQNQGRIAAVEPIKSRFFRLRANLQRFDVTIVDTYLKDGRDVGRQVPDRFDRVLLDAPCSSEARIRVYEPETWKHWSPRKVKEMQRKQKGLLRSALNAVRPGGVVVYSTCSFAPEENEMVVDDQLRRFDGELVVEPVDPGIKQAFPGLVRWGKRDLDPDLARAVRILPDGLLDGFFLCRIRRLS